MIEIAKLTENDKGREVVFDRSGKEREYGHISSWNEHYIFVKYGGSQNSQATKPEYLKFADEVREKMIIRKWQPEDLPDIYRIMGYIPAMDVLDYPEFAKCVTNGTFPKVLVAEKNKKTVGIMIYNIQYNLYGKSDIWLFCLSVEGKYRRQGIATALIQELRKIAKKVKADEISLCVYKENEGAKRFYHGLGVRVDVPDEDFIFCILPVEK